MVNIVKSAADVQFLKTIDKSAVTEDGEIIEFRPECPFRSITDLKAFSDAEKKKGVSMTDPSQYEPLESIIARCRRGEMIFDADKGWYAVDGKHVDDALDNYEELVDDLTAIDDAAIAIQASLQQPVDAPAIPPTEGETSPSPVSDNGEQQSA